MAKTIRVDALARVEGEGALTVRFKGKTIRSVELRIFEPPRFFEGFLRGRSQFEVPDMTARICGICPVAYQMSSVHALEAAHGIHVTGPIRDLRRLLYCGEWIESHVLHMFMLHAPDFLGYEDAIAMAKDHGDKVKLALSIKKAGNEIVDVLGGRAIHPVNVKLGGFFRAPTRNELRALLPSLTKARDDMRAALRWVATLEFPDLERNWELVSLVHPDEYPMNEGRIHSTRGLDTDASAYDQHMVEEHVAHSNALHARIKGRGPFLTGPLARFALNFDRLLPGAKEAAADAGVTAACRNPFQSLLVRGVEVVQALEDALAIIGRYEPPQAPAVTVPMTAGTGAAATEAPRGLLWHRYEVDAQGLIAAARIVPPTSQNQLSIEDDVRSLGTRLVELPHDAARRLAEQSVRNHDPCISCATHFLELRREEEA